MIGVGMMKKNSHCPNFARLNRRRAQSGAVLTVVLVVLVVMMLGSLSLLRSVDTSALLAGNIAFKRHSLNASTVGMNTAFGKFMTTDFISYADSDAGCDSAAASGSCTYRSNWKALNYVPRLLEADANGVPLILKGSSPSSDTVFSTGTPYVTIESNKVRFVIERMCTDYGAVTEARCAISNNFEVGGSARSNKPGSTAMPLYRVTVRTDGMRNSQTYTQAIVTTQVK
jgi:Tfp pilus assembly protein PilX